MIAHPSRDQAPARERAGRVRATHGVHRNQPLGTDPADGETPTLRAPFHLDRALAAQGDLR